MLQFQVLEHLIRAKLNLFELFFNSKRLQIKISRFVLLFKYFGQVDATVSHHLKFASIGVFCKKTQI